MEDVEDYDIDGGLVNVCLIKDGILFVVYLV